MKDMVRKREQKIDYRSFISVALIAIVMILIGLAELAKSQLWGYEQRFNLVWLDGVQVVNFVSFDPSQEQVLVIEYPAGLLIKSRSVGSYKVGDLARLGGYEGSTGEFVRRKVQGFMKVPAANYLLGREGGMELGNSLLWSLLRGGKVSSLSRLDSMILLARLSRYQQRVVGQDELVRSGILTRQENREEWEYQAGRLQQFLGSRVFDWKVGERGWTVAVINESGEPGLATDVSDFLSNGGMDVVAVRSGEEGSEREESEVIMGMTEEEEQDLSRELLKSWFGWENFSMGETSYYRAEIVVKLGKDAQELF